MLESVHTGHVVVVVVVVVDIQSDIQKVEWAKVILYHLTEVVFVFYIVLYCVYCLICLSFYLDR